MLTMSLVALTLASVTGIQVADIIAEEEEKNEYKSAESVEITALFEFTGNQDELVAFQVFDQISGFNQAEEPAMIELTKIVGDTPLLHDFADDARHFSRTQQEHDNKWAEISIDIGISQQFRNC